MGGSRGRLISLKHRLQSLLLIAEAVKSGARKSKACEMLGLTVRTIERWEKQEKLIDGRKTADRLAPANKLTEQECKMILQIANSEKYRDLPPSKIVPLLADEKIYIASESSFYRVLREKKQLTHRLAVRSAKHHKPKEYLACRANQVWSWDISYLPSQITGQYFYLYFIMDIYSRKVVGWSIHEAESSEHAANLIKQSCLDEAVEEGQLVLHSDNGSPMKGMTMIAMLETLGVTSSFSRPSVSDDNPYSESLFKTLKYHPDFPRIKKFKGILEAREWTEKFVSWYNNKHLHSALKFVTPLQRHNGEDKMILQKRHEVYVAAKMRHPERWSGKTRNWKLAGMVTLNPNKKLRDLCSSKEQIISAA